VKAGRGAHSTPVIGDERARDGDGAIVLNEMVKAGNFGEYPQEMVGYRGARKIVDEPA